MKHDRRSAAQVIYDGANAAYQKAWREDMVHRERVNKAAADMLAVDPENPLQAMGLMGHYMTVRAELMRREARTAELLAAREEAYRLLILPTG